MSTTTDGRKVVDVFELCDTHGFPLPIAIALTHEKGAQVDWGAFLTKARKAGWNMTRKLVEFREAVRENYGEAYAAEWHARALKFLEETK